MCKLVKMITLSQRLKRQQETAKSNNRISVRDKLLTREAQEMSQLLPSNCTVSYSNINDLSTCILTVKPVEGFWQDGSFKFSIEVTEEYNMVVCAKFFVDFFPIFFLCMTNIFCCSSLLL